MWIENKTRVKIYFEEQRIRNLGLTLADWDISWFWPRLTNISQRQPCTWQVVCWVIRWSPSDETTYLGYETTLVIFLSHKFISVIFEFRIHFYIDVYSYFIQLSQEEQDDCIGCALQLSQGAAKLRRPKRTVFKLRSFPDNHLNAVLKKILPEKITRPGDVGIYPVTVCFSGSCHRREFWKLRDFLRTWKQVVKG